MRAERVIGAIGRIEERGARSACFCFLLPALAKKAPPPLRPKKPPPPLPLPPLHPPAEQVEDDDEVLLVMADELGRMVDLAGGPKEAVVLIGPLGALASVEETLLARRTVMLYPTRRGQVLSV